MAQKAFDVVVTPVDYYAFHHAHRLLDFKPTGAIHKAKPENHNKGTWSRKTMLNFMEN